jgi:hypothetical protein
MKERAHLFYDKAWKWMKLWLVRYGSPAKAAAVGILLITIMALFVPPYIGMADNGDYFRSLYSNGLYFNTPNYDSYYFGYFVKEYGIFQYFNENGGRLFTSQTLFLKLSLWINMLFDTVTFDIRVQAAVFTLLYTIAIYLLVEAITWKLPVRYGYPIAALSVFIFADTGYTAYFNSFFGESIVLIMMLFVLASALLLYRKRYNDYALLAVFFVSAVLLTTSKQQNAPVGIIISLAGIFLIFIRKQKQFRVLVATALAGLMLTSVATYTLIPKEFVNINKYHAMTRGILLHSDNPEQALSHFGINPQYAILSESNYYELYTTVDVNSPVLEEHFYKQYGFASILGFYLNNPAKAIGMLNLAATSAFQIRPPAMGNYEISAGKPFGAQTSFFSGYSLFKASVAPKTFGFILIWMVLVIGLYLPSFISAIRRRDRRGALYLPVIVTFILMGLSGIMVSIIGAGDADLAKHEFVFTAAFDIVTFLLVSDLIHRSLWKAPSPSSTITEPAIQVLEPTGTVVSMSAKVINHNA